MRNKCIVCGAPLYNEPLFICRDMPAKSQDLPTADNMEEDWPMDFNLCQCSGCGLVQFDCEPVSYYLDSTRAGERSSVLVDMRRSQYKHLIETYNLQGKKIIEIGAGKGGFLKTLQEMQEYHVNGYGIENNPEFVRIARDVEGVEVTECNPESSDWEHPEAPFDAFMSFAYPARLINPNAMLKGIYRNVKDGAIGIVQVPSLEHLIRPGGFYDLTADHIAYYSRKTLRFLLEKNGFEVLEEGDAGSIYIYAIVKKRTPYNLAESWSDVQPLADKVKKFVEDERKNSRKIAVWCAGHFSFTVLSVVGIGKEISYVIDNAKFKQGCFTPASHVPIVSPEHFFDEPADTIMVLAPFYADEIIKEIRDKYPANVKVVVMNQTELIVPE